VTLEECCILPGMFPDQESNQSAYHHREMPLVLEYKTRNSVCNFTAVISASARGQYHIETSTFLPFQ